MQTRDVLSSDEASAVDGFKPMKSTDGRDASQVRRNS
jgi:hypothetical protein